MKLKYTANDKDIFNAAAWNGIDKYNVIERDIPKIVWTIAETQTPPRYKLIRVDKAWSVGRGGSITITEVNIEFTVEEYTYKELLQYWLDI